MTVDLELATRIRAVLSGHPDIREQSMMGGLTFMSGGKMACGVIGDQLMVRVGPEAHAEALSRPHVRPMDFTGRPLSGFVYVAPAGIKTRAALTEWLERGLAYAAIAATRPTSLARPVLKRAPAPAPAPAKPSAKRPAVTATRRPRAR